MQRGETYRFPVTVVLERRQVQQGRWSVPQWDAVGVVAGEGQQELEPSVIRVDERCEQHLWPGFVLELFKDAAESYWYNLVGRKPALYVVCREDDEQGLAPLRVTANYDEAVAHVEGDDQVFPVPIPPEIYGWLERYVVENYVPKPPKKRRRRDWAREAFDRDKPSK